MLFLPYLDYVKSYAAAVANPLRQRIANSVVWLTHTERYQSHLFTFNLRRRRCLSIYLGPVFQCQKFRTYEMLHHFGMHFSVQIHAAVLSKNPVFIG